MNGGGILCADKTIKYDPGKAVLKYRIGDEIRLNAADFDLLSSAFFGDIERKYLRTETNRMKNLIAGRFVIILSLALVLARGYAQNPTSSPAQEYQAIRKEYETAASGTGTTDDDRRKSIARVDALRDGLAQKFLNLAEKNPNDPIAVDALIQAIWMVSGNSFPAGGPESAGGKAMALLLREHVRSEKIGPICLRISSGFRREYEPFLRTILERNPHKSAQALACLALAQYLNNRSQRLDQIKRQPELAKGYEELFGKEYLAEMRQKNRAKIAREVEGLFERAAREYADEKIPYEGTVGAKAGAELFELHNLFAGKVAPDIEGEDQDGKRFKLGDYRGKVVMLDFWNKY